MMGLEDARWNLCVTLGRLISLMGDVANERELGLPSCSTTMRRRDRLRTLPVVGATARAAGD